jgi:hypothetical protein
MIMRRSHQHNNPSHKKQSRRGNCHGGLIGSPTWIRTRNLLINSQPLYR